MSLRSIFGDLNEKELNVRLKIGNISRILLLERYKRNMSQTEFGKLIGVSQSMISKLESFDYNPSLKKLFEISEKLGLDLDIVQKERTPLSEEHEFRNFDDFGELADIFNRSESMENIKSIEDLKIIPFPSGKTHPKFNILAELENKVG